MLGAFFFFEECFVGERCRYGAVKVIMLHPMRRDGWLVGFDILFLVGKPR